ncbi:MAG: hypothetical protein ACM3UZ_07480 [Acidobacteriota bacterium]
MVDGVNRINPVSSTGLYKVYGVNINTPSRNQYTSTSVSPPNQAKDSKFAVTLGAQEAGSNVVGKSSDKLIGGVDKNIVSEKAAKQAGFKECKT